MTIRKTLLGTAVAACLMTPALAQTPTTLFQGSWVDVMSGANGCAAAVPGQISRIAVQCQIDYLFSHFNGGSVVIPCATGPFLIDSPGLILKGAVSTFFACGQNGAGLWASGDNTVITVDAATCARGGVISNGTIVGNQSSSSTQTTVTIGKNCATNLIDNTIWGGVIAVFTAGFDGRYRNNFVAAAVDGGAGYFSSGANFIEGGKIDSAFPGIKNYGFVQTECTGSVCENQIINTDFSGAYYASMLVADEASVIKCTNCIMGGPVLILSARATSFVNSEMPAIVLNNGTGPLSIVANVDVGHVTIYGSGPRVCAATYQVTGC